MRAVLSKAVGGPETITLGDVATPEPAEDQLLIRVRACGLNFPDLLMVRDLYQVKPPRPFVPGIEVAGEVAAVGSGVSGFKIGDRVSGTMAYGGMAEFAVAAASKCIVIPDSVPHDDAAAFVTTYGTTYHALKQRARAMAGETLLVLGASGGVGLSAVELGKLMGMKVIAAASTQAKVDLALKRGADQGVVYPANVTAASIKELSQLFKSVIGPNGVDVVYDSIGGPYSEAAFRSMAWRGRFLVIGFPAGISSIPLNLTLLKGAEIVGVFYGSFTEREPELHMQNTRELLDLYVAGKFRPYISARYSFADAAKGFAALGDRTATGKIVLTPE